MVELDFKHCRIVDSLDWISMIVDAKINSTMAFLSLDLRYQVSAWIEQSVGYSFFTEGDCSRHYVITTYVYALFPFHIPSLG